MGENWKIGDVAICVNNGDLDITKGGKLPPLRLNTEYIVKDIFQCRCGYISLDVGLGNNSNRGTSCSCEAILPYNDVHWCSASRFVKKKAKATEADLEEAIANENYELAKEIKEELNKQ